MEDNDDDTAFDDDEDLDASKIVVVPKTKKRKIARKKGKHVSFNLYKNKSRVFSRNSSISKYSIYDLHLCYLRVYYDH